MFNWKDTRYTRMFNLKAVVALIGSRDHRPRRGRVRRRR